MKYTNVAFHHAGHNASVSIDATCPYGHATLVDASELSHSENNCDLCGSHGDLELSWECAECETGYIYTLDSW